MLRQLRGLGFGVSCTSTARTGCLWCMLEIGACWRWGLGTILQLRGAVLAPRDKLATQCHGRRAVGQRICEMVEQRCRQRLFNTVTGIPHVKEQFVHMSVRGVPWLGTTGRHRQQRHWVVRHHAAMCSSAGLPSERHFMLVPHWLTTYPPAQYLQHPQLAVGQGRGWDR